MSDETLTADETDRNGVPVGTSDRESDERHAEFARHWSPAQGARDAEVSE